MKIPFLPFEIKKSRPCDCMDDAKNYLDVMIDRHKPGNREALANYEHDIQFRRLRENVAEMSLDVEQVAKRQKTHLLLSLSIYALVLAIFIIIYRKMR